MTASWGEPRYVDPEQALHLAAAIPPRWPYGLETEMVKLAPTTDGVETTVELVKMPPVRAVKPLVPPMNPSNVGPPSAVKRAVRLAVRWWLDAPKEPS